MRAGLIVLWFALIAAGCAAASAQSSDECVRSSDCVLFGGCCRDCCHCPTTVMSQRQASDECALMGACEAPECSGVQCGPCVQPRPACVRGRCVARPAR